MCMNRGFMGEYQHNIDQKGRLIIPSKFREALGDIFVLTRGLDNCLFIYTQSEWETLEEKISKLPLTRKDARRFSRFFFSGAVECEVDKQGRVNIPGALRDYSKLEKECIVTGISNRIEIWSKEIWEDYNEESEELIEESLENLGDIDI